MWIFTKYGFFSAVCARKGDGKHGQPVNPDRIMVRARSESHLTALKDRFPELLGECEVVKTPATDYAYRLFVPKSVWVQVLAKLAEETDYDNFKSEVAQQQGRAGATYERSLHDVWSVMHKLQKSEPCRSDNSKRIAALLPFLDLFDDADFAVESNTEPDVISQFQQALYDNGWIKADFNWPDWQDIAAQYVESPGAIASADADTIEKLFTTHVRKERFCEGHFEQMIESGHVKALLHRLSVIDDEVR